MDNQEKLAEAVERANYYLPAARRGEPVIHILFWMIFCPPVMEMDEETKRLFAAMEKDHGT